MEILETRQMLAFNELAKLGSFTKVADKLGLTQSAVSHTIKNLEKQLDVNLFQRLGKNVTLTIEGELLLTFSDQIIKQIKSAQDGIQNAKRPGYGRLRIGATVCISQYLLPSILREVRKIFPNYQIKVITEDTKKLISLLEKGELDYAIGLNLPISNCLKSTKLFYDQIEMAISPMHSICNKQIICLEDIADEEFIYYKNSYETFHIIEDVFCNHPTTLKSSIQVGSMAAIKEMVKFGMGIGLLPKWTAPEEISSGTLEFRELPYDKTDRVWCIYELKNDTLSAAKQTFIDICKDVIKDRNLGAESSRNDKSIKFFPNLEK